jgi:hypothetical protein
MEEDGIYLDGDIFRYYDLYTDKIYIAIIAS